MNRASASLNGTQPASDIDEDRRPTVKPKAKKKRKAKKRPRAEQPKPALEALPDRWQGTRRDHMADEETMSRVVADGVQRVIDTPLVLLESLLTLASDLAYKIQRSHAAPCRCHHCHDRRGEHAIALGRFSIAGDLSAITTICRQQARVLRSVTGDRMEQLRRRVGIDKNYYEELALLAWIAKSMWPTVGHMEKLPQCEIRLPIEVKAPTVAV